jgi:hypothetical protein
MAPIDDDAPLLPAFEPPRPVARVVVADPPGQPTTLTVCAVDGAVAAIGLGPSELVALAHDLLTAARRRYGR